MPRNVNSPRTSLTPPAASNRKFVATKYASGYSATASRSGSRRRASSRREPVESVATGMRRRRSPVFAARSIVTSPLTGPMRPRSVDVPKCITSNVTNVWFGSSWYVTGPAMDCASAGSMPALAHSASTAPRAAGPALLLDGFNLDDQMHVVGEAVVQAVRHAVLAAHDRRVEVAAADFALDHRVHVAVEVLRLQHDRVGLAIERQVAVDLGDLVAVEDELRRHELGGGVRRDVEDLLAGDVLGERGGAGVQRRGVDGDVQRAGLGSLVERDGAARLVEAAAVGRGAEVADLERRERVARVDGVGGRLRVGGSGKTEGDGDGQQGELGHGRGSWGQESLEESAPVLTRTTGREETRAQGQSGATPVSVILNF